METETCDTTKSTQSTPPCLSSNEEKSTFQNTSGSTSTNDAFNFEVSDSLREGIFNSLLGNSPIEAANYEYRTNPSFLELLNKVNDNCRKLMLEKFKFINLSLPMTRSSGLRDQLEAGITKYPTLFEYVVICSLKTDIVELGEVTKQIPSSVTSNILFLQVDHTESCSILEFLSFLFRKGHGSSFLYIDLDMFDLSKRWTTLVDSFRCISTLKSLSMKCTSISNAQLLRLLRILKNALLQSCYALLDAQWTEPNFSDILDFLQRKRISLKASFDCVSLQILATSDVPFEPLWMTDKTSLYLDNGKIDSNGLKYLSEALKENDTLTGLYIGGNNITSEGVKYLSEALKENDTLTVLNINNNNITSEGAKYLSEALKENHTLTVLNIDYNNITSEGEIFSSQINQYLKRNQSELNTKKSNASNINKSLDQSTLKTNTTTQHLLALSKYASCLNQSYLQYKSTVLKEMNLLFILFMQHRRLEQQESSSHISIYPPFEMMTYFVTNTSNSVDIRTQPKYFETEDYVCSICCSICTDPCCSENCSHVFCKICIEAWTESSCPTCRTFCTDWRVTPFAERIILNLRLQCPHSCGWQGALIDYERNHKGQCPCEMGECSSCHLELKRSEFFDSHYGNCIYHLVCCDYCHCAIPSTMLCAHKAHECAFAPIVCDACHSLCSTWHSWKVHIEKDCDKVFEYCDFYEFGCQVYLERGDLKKHETEAIGYHVELLKEALRKTRAGVKC
ncbi:hypothetical protein GpartN1_g6670.t1 [Galdieria partita]|uniref:RING-type domain-containing protein n=1 Tax=Galdieria partita TaxID=83374 RepID=A0A9C7Q213_9RHOD|nr:hypothetical protein GpartN1_g6670.t1 [Galdieria partita]